MARLALAIPIVMEQDEIPDVSVGFRDLQVEARVAIQFKNHQILMWKIVTAAEAKSGCLSASPGMYRLMDENSQ